MAPCKRCGLAGLPCGCCEGTRVLTPAPIFNRPGLPALAFRSGTHGSFFETMKARLATLEVDGADADGQAAGTQRPLRALTTRDTADFSIALLDGWATIADLLGFYQERIANEGYLRTATERRSVLELARLVGYTLRPGVAASVHLAYTLDDNQVDPTTLAAGERAQSLPGPGETPQAFETGEDLYARREWNDLKVRLRRPQAITLATALTLPDIVVSTQANSLRAGDPLLLMFQDKDAQLPALRTIRSTAGPTADGRWTLHLDPVGDTLAATIASLVHLVLDLEAMDLDAYYQNFPDDTKTAAVIAQSRTLLVSVLLDHAASPAEWAGQLEKTGTGIINLGVSSRLDAFGLEIDGKLKPQGGTAAPVTSDPDQFVGDLLKPRVPQKANSLQLRRDLGQAFGIGADTAPQLLLKFAPPLRDSYYQAWAGANVNAAQPMLAGVYALRTLASLFGASVPRQVDGFTNGVTMPQGQWPEWTLDGEATDALFLDQLYPGVTAPSLAVVTRMDSGAPRTQVLTVASAATTQRAAYGITGKATRLQFGRDWWEARVPPAGAGEPNDMRVLRTTVVWAQSDALTLADEPMSATVSGDSIELAALHQELESGRWVILGGERADIPGVAGVRVAELMMVAGLVHGFDDTLPGDTAHTRLQLATPTAFTYKRDTLVLYGNVVRATHGETRNELLGSGDATAALQAFTLKQPPLTFVSASTAAGAESALSVYVDDVQWHETPSLAWLGPKDRGFVAATDDSGQTSVTFGDGDHGMRLPTGVQNVRAVYRSGIGAPGNLKAEQISLLATRPLGVKAVINPLRSAGGADREDRDLARANAPLAVMALDRLVSVQDYADFTRTFAGIAKAVATRTSDGTRELVFLTVAGAADAPVDKTSDLYRNLLDALRKLGDADLALRVEARELLALVVSANVALQPDYLWEPVATAVRARLLDVFGFGRRALGQGVCTAEVIATIQAVPGVACVDIDTFTAIPEKETRDGQRQLITQAGITQRIAAAIDGPDWGEGPGQTRAAGLPPNIVAFAGGNDADGLRPAELAIFTSAVADTIILKQLT